MNESNCCKDRGEVPIHHRAVIRKLYASSRQTVARFTVVPRRGVHFHRDLFHHYDHVSGVWSGRLLVVEFPTFGAALLPQPIGQIARPRDHFLDVLVSKRPLGREIAGAAFTSLHYLDCTNIAHEYPGAANAFEPRARDSTSYCRINALHFILLFHEMRISLRRGYLKTCERVLR